MIILILQWLAILFFTALIHECGHALACRYFGIPVLEIMLWSGSQRYRLQLGRFAIGWFPYGGYVATPFVKEDAVDFAITFCGPAANFIIGTGVFFSSGMIKVFFLFNVLMAINAMLPISNKKDGYRLLLILKKWYSSRMHCK